MSANELLALIIGMLAGGCFGYVATWRFSRKLEHHGVRLAEWDQLFDMRAPPPSVKGDRIAVADQVLEHPTRPRLARVGASLTGGTP